MNISLSPNESLSRMLHTFSATAYEVGAADYPSLLSSGLLKKAYVEDNTTTSELKSFSIHQGQVTLDDVVLLEVFDWFGGMDNLKVLNNNTIIPPSYSSAATGYVKWENLPSSTL
jgi:hypothetical protein